MELPTLRSSRCRYMHCLRKCTVPSLPCSSTPFIPGPNIGCALPAAALTHLLCIRLFLCNSNCAARAWIVLGQAIRFAVDLGEVSLRLPRVLRRAYEALLSLQASIGHSRKPSFLSWRKSDDDERSGRSTRLIASSPPISVDLSLSKKATSTPSDHWRAATRSWKHTA